MNAIELRLKAAEKELENYVFLEDIEDIAPYDWLINEGSGENDMDSTEIDDAKDHNIFGHQYYRRITNFKICDVFGIRLKSFFIDDTDPSRYFLLLGELLPCNTTDAAKEPTVKVKIPITDWFFTFGLSLKDTSSDIYDAFQLSIQENHFLEEGYWVEDYLATRYHLLFPCLDEYREIYDFCLKQAHCAFNPIKAPFGRIVHPVMDYSIVDCTGTHMLDPVHHLSQLDYNYTPIYAKGKILNSTNERYLKVLIPFFRYEISFGLRNKSSNAELETKEDINHGIFFHHLNGLEDLWFKLVNPSKEYADQKILDYFDPFCKKICGFMRSTKFYSAPYQKITDFQLVTYNGKDYQGTFPSMNEKQTGFLSSSSIVSSEASIADPYKSLVSLSGKLCTENENIWVRSFVQNYVFDSGRREKDEVTVYMFSPVAEPLYYRLYPSAESCISGFNIILNDYDWPSEEGSTEIWRRIQDYSLKDSEGKYTTLLFKDPERRTINTLTGSLLPSPEYANELPLLPVQLYVDGYSIDFGRSVDDSARGLWMSEIHQVWFKIIDPPSTGYEKLGTMAISHTTKFLQFHDTLKYYQSADRKDSSAADSPPVGFCYFDDEGSYVCESSIKELYLKSNKNFDIKFVAENKEFIKDNLSNVINFALSRKFYFSLRTLDGQFICFFSDLLCSFFSLFVLFFLFIIKLPV
jgi:hypothetical protein